MYVCVVSIVRYQKLLLSVSVIETVRYRQVEIHWNAYIFARALLYCTLKEVSVEYSCPLKQVSLYSNYLHIARDYRKKVIIL